MLDKRAKDIEMIPEDFKCRWVERPYGATSKLHSDADLSVLPPWSRCRRTYFLPYSRSPSNFLSAPCTPTLLSTPYGLTSSIPVRTAPSTPTTSRTASAPLPPVASNSAFRSSDRGRAVAPCRSARASLDGWRSVANTLENMVVAEVIAHSPTWISVAARTRRA
jgi:hypothetical protein